MSFSSAEERALAEMERELAEDETLAGLAGRFNRLSRRGKRFGVPAASFGWVITLLLSGLGVVLLIAGVISGNPSAIAAAGVIALLFQIPVVTLAMLTRRRRPNR